MARSRLSKRKKIVLFSIAGFLLLVFLLLFAGKEWILNKAISKVQQKLHDKYNLTLTIGAHRLQGWTHVEMDKINCQTPTHDTLAYLNRVAVSIKLWPILTGKLRMENIEADNGLLDIDQVKDVRKNGSGADNGSAANKDTSKFARARKYVSYLKDMAESMPDQMQVKDIQLRFHDSAVQVQAFINTLDYHQDALKAEMTLSTGNTSQQWTAAGTFKKSNLKTHLNVSTTSPSFYSFGFVRKLAKSDIGLQSFTVDLDKLDENDNQISISGAVYGDKVHIYNPKVSPDTLTIDHGGMKYNLAMDTGKISFTHTDIVLNELQATLDADYAYKTPKWVKGSLAMKPVEAQTFINSLPGGTFDNIHGLGMEGSFSYKLDFILDLYKYDTINVNSDLDGEGLKITRYGKEDFRKINGTFTYIPYNSKRPILVGPENPNFVTLPEVSPYLVNAVLSMEDPGFRYHKGFEPEAFNGALKENLKKSEFKRGGSTISQQLVKNIFLSHRKTLDRKVEEALIVWLIENLHLSTKNRMLEVYLNIIEWGPNIYGVKEATHFYFNKEPSQLTLSESIFLAHIIRAPLKFMWNFDDQGHLKPFAQQKERATAYTMSRRKLITEEEFAAFWPEVNITGDALHYMRLAPKDSTNVIPDTNDDNW